MFDCAEEIMAICGLTAVFSLGTAAAYFVTFYKVDAYPVIQGLFILIWVCLFVIYLLWIWYFIHEIWEYFKKAK